jgi:NAD(P)-dependent dehydrogenase (short-subunit alcohol dehydrogenase family)
MKMLEGKVVIVTGAGRGIGREIALAMARHGARVVVNDLGVELDGSKSASNPATEVVELIRSEGGEALVSLESVADWESANRIVRTAIDGFGQLDCVVNNAGILRDVMFHKLEPRDWELVIQVMLHGAFYMCRAAIGHMRERQTGSFVQMISASGLAGNYGQSAYASAKAGMVGLSKSIAIDAQRYNVRSNCIAPSAWTRMTSSIPDTPENAARIAQRKQVTPDKNAPLAVYLASDLASGVNGQIFATRMNEIFLMSQSRPLRSIHRSEGWTPETIATHAIPALKSSFYPLERNQDVFSWDPV